MYSTWCSRLRDWFSHTWFIYNLNTTFIRYELTCAMIHTRTAFHEYRSAIQSFPLLPLLPATPVYKLHFLLTCKSHFWWSWCECPSTLVPGWWSTAHPSVPTLPLPSQRLPQFMIHIVKDDITTSVMLPDTTLSPFYSTVWAFCFDSKVEYFCKRLISNLFAKHVPNLVTPSLHLLPEQRFSWRCMINSTQSTRNISRKFIF